MKPSAAAGAPAPPAGDLSNQLARALLSAHLLQVPAFRALLRTVEALLMAGSGPLAPPLLDLGCGDGLFAALVLPTPVDAGVDLDLAALRQARGRRVHRLAVAASASALPFTSGSFASVIANCSLEHIVELDQTLREVGHVLRPGGRFLLTVPSHAFAELLLGSTLLRALRLGRLASIYGHWFNRHSSHFWTDDPDTWLARLAHHGLTVERWQYYFAPAAHRIFDLAHYLGVPRLLAFRLTGRWGFFRRPLFLGLAERLCGRFASAKAPPLGAYIFFAARSPSCQQTRSS